MKELVDHIRTVHFALVIGSAILIAAGLSRPQLALEQASRDAKAISTLAQRQPALVEAIEAEANRRFGNPDPVKELPRRPPKAKATHYPPGDPREAPFGVEGQFQTVWFAPWIAVGKGSDRTVFESPFRNKWLYMVRRSDPEPYARGTDVAPDHEIDLPEWQRLEDFVTYWDGIPTVVARDGSPPLRMGGTATVKCADGKTTTAEVLKEPEPRFRLLRYRTEWRADLGEVRTQIVLNMADDPGVRLPDDTKTRDSGCVLDLLTPRVRVEVRRTIADKLRELDAQVSGQGPLNSFAVVFNDLDKQTINLRRLPLEDVANELARRMTETRETIELFGVKLPSAVLASIGTLMLLGCQLYLYLHLNELLAIVDRNGSELLPTGYVGLYAQTAARMISGVTLLFFPAISIGLILANDRRSLWTLATAASISGALGLLCLLRLVQVWRCVKGKKSSGGVTARSATVVDDGAGDTDSSPSSSPVS